MALSRMLGIPTAWSAIVEFSDGEPAYLTRRYDRIEGQKLHQEDLAQGFGLQARNKYEKSYEESLHLAHDMSGGKLSVVRDLFDRILFAYVIGNNDMLKMVENSFMPSHMKKSASDIIRDRMDALKINS